jgi:hypothetical protein
VSRTAERRLSPDEAFVDALEERASQRHQHIVIDDPKGVVSRVRYDG